MNDLHTLAGRGPFRATTEFVNRRIFSELALGPDDRFVDVGCGNGFLLGLAQEKRVHSIVGLNATDEEVEPLRALGFNVVKGVSDSIPLPDGFATAVVCNSVLLLIPESNMLNSLREIARICAHDARLYVGEIPRIEEVSDIPKHETIPQMLWWLLRNRGVRSFAGMCHRLLTGTQRGPVIVNPQAAVFFATPERFISMAEQAGLRVERHFSHQRSTATNIHVFTIPATTIFSVRSEGPRGDVVVRLSVVGDQENCLGGTASGASLNR
jgi:SAM-dependent methyltransferase